MIRRFLAPSFACLAFSAAIQAASLVNSVEDRAAAFLYVQDFQKLRAQYAKSPFAKTSADDSVRKYFAPLIAKINFDEWDSKQKARTGMSFDELLGLAQGEILLAVHADVGAGSPAEPVLLVAIGSNEQKVEKLITTLQEEKPERTEAEAEEDRAETVFETSEVGGVTLHSVFEVREDEEKGQQRNEVTCWAVTQGNLVVSRNQEGVGRALANLARGVDAPLGKSELFLRTAQKLEGTGVIGAVDFNVTMPALLDSWKASMTEKSANPMINPEGVFNALGLLKLDAFAAALSFGDEAMDSHVAFTYHAPEGLVGLLALQDGPVPQPAFVPERWVSVASARFKLNDSYAALEKILQDYNPAMYAMGMGMLAGMNKQYGIDLKRDIFGALGDEFIVASARRSGSSRESPGAFDVDEFYAVSLQNPKTMTGTLETLSRSFDPQNQGRVTKRDFQGISITTLGIGADALQRPRTVSYAVVGQHLMISVGTASALEAAIRTSKGEEKTWWQRADVKQALAEVPAKAASFSFQDNRAMIGFLFAAIDQASQSAAGKEGGEPWVDSSAKPDIDAISKYWSSSYGYSWRDSNGIYAKSTLPYVK